MFFSLCSKLLNGNSKLYFKNVSHCRVLFTFILNLALNFHIFCKIISTADVAYLLHVIYSTANNPPTDKFPLPNSLPYPIEFRPSLRCTAYQQLNPTDRVGHRLIRRYLQSCRAFGSQPHSAPAQYAAQRYTHHQQRQAGSNRKRLDTERSVEHRLFARAENRSLRVESLRVGIIFSIMLESVDRYNHSRIFRHDQLPAR